MAQPKIGYLLYNLLLTLGSLVLIPYILLRNLILRRPVMPYLRGLGRAERLRLTGQPVIWLQAVSVGETVLAQSIVTELQKQLPKNQIVFTTTTPTGQAMAAKLMGGRALVTYFPFDFPWLVRRFVRALQPQLFIMVETEIWPNAIRCCKEHGARVALVNGRISDRSFPKYHFFRKFLSAIFAQVDCLAMQSQADAGRIIALGALPEQVRVTGNTKFDQPFPSFTQEQLDGFRRTYHWPVAAHIFAAASTHPGEEEQVIAAFKLLPSENDWRLVLAPRHPDRAAEMTALLKKASLSFVRRSEAPPKQAPQVLLLDTFGELGLIYAVADAVFTGGSLVPVGGHNILEAAVQSKPVLYGPQMHNFRESRRLLEVVGAGVTIHNAVELAEQVQWIVKNEADYKAKGVAARQAVLANQGASARTVELLVKLLEEQL